MYVNANEVLLTAIETNVAKHAYVDEAKSANESSLIMSIPSYVDILADRDI